MSANHDDAFVVTDALRWSEAAYDLVNLFQLMSISDRDQAHPAYIFYDSIARPSNEWMDRDDWISKCYLKAMAEEAIRAALTSGRLQVWTADHQGERLRDHTVLFASSQCNWSSSIATGRYIAVQHMGASPPSYVGARIWLKSANWLAVRAKLIAERSAANRSSLPEGLDKILGLEPPMDLPGNHSGGGVDRGALKQFIADIKRNEGKLPHVARGLLKRAKGHFSPREVTRTMVEQAVAELDLKRAQSRPRKNPG